MEKQLDELTESNLLKERLAHSGAQALTDIQLLALLLGRGEVKEQHIVKSKHLLSTYNTLDALFASTHLPLTGNVGNLFKATAELTQRIKKEVDEIEVINNNHDAERVIRPLLKGTVSEEFWVITLNRGGRIIDKRCISKGGVNATLVDLKLMMKYVISTLATSVIVAHNHPSGVIEPSGEDMEITKKIVAALAFFDIKLLDHIIIGGEESYSFREKGII